MVSTVACVIGLLLISAVIVGLLVRGSGVFGALDIPNQRSLHTQPVPRTGGIPIVLTWCLFLFLSPLVSRELMISLTPGIGALVVVAWYDDKGHVNTLLRLGIQCLAAMLFVGIGLDSIGEELSGKGGFVRSSIVLAEVLAIVWSVNLYNFMDGMDGLAGSMAVIGFVTLGLLGWFSNQTGYALLMFAVVAATLGFLVFNWPPARIFMGDMGSTFLGYLMATTSLWGWDHGIFPLWVPLLIFLPFWLDATITLLRRIARGECFWEAHREHFYQRAVLAGVPVRRVLFMEIGLMLLTSSLAISGWLYWISG